MFNDESTQTREDNPPIFTENLRLENSQDFSWAALGKTTIPKEQGTCGSCWAHGTVSMAESHLLINYPNLYKNTTCDLSEQYLLRCTSGCSCSGGYMNNVLSQMKKGGIPTERQFPYNPSITQSGICSTTISRIQITTVTSTYKNCNDD